jgi:hypothetical protein
LKNIQKSYVFMEDQLYEKNMYIRLMILFLIGILMFSLVACGGSSAETTETTEGITPAVEIEDSTKASSTEQVAATTYDTDWAIYWYLCGSDLESGGGQARRYHNNVGFCYQDGCSIKAIFPHNILVSYSIYRSCQQLHLF